MSDAMHTVSLLTAEPDFKIHTVGTQPPVIVHRQTWQIGAEAGVESDIDAELVMHRLATDEPQAVCIAPDVPEQLALELARLFDQHHPNVGVILVRTATQRLWKESARSGVRDIIPPSAIDSDLLPALLKAVERCVRLSTARVAELPPPMAFPPPKVPTGKVIVVLSPKGGSGKTMVASNLAAALAHHTGGGTVLVDLDCVFGDVASVLGLVPEHTVGHLAMLPEVDSTTLKVLLTRHEESGLHVLAGSGVPEEGETVTDELSGRVIEMLARDFAYVVVDTAAGLDERAFAAIEKATDIVFVASMDITSIRNLGKEINALDRLGMTSAKRSFILNRADAQVGLEVGDVEAALGMTVTAALPSSRLVPLSMNRGKTLVLEQPDSPVAQQLLSLAASFLPVEAGDQADSRKARPFWKRKS